MDKKRIIGKENIIEAILAHTKRYFNDHQGEFEKEEMEFWKTLIGEINANNDNIALGMLFGLAHTKNSFNDKWITTISKKLKIPQTWDRKGVLSQYLADSMEMFLKSKVYYLYNNLNLSTPNHLSSTYTLETDAGVLYHLLISLKEAHIIDKSPNDKGGWQAAFKQLIGNTGASKVINDWKSKNIKSIFQYKELLEDLADHLGSSYEYIWVDPSFAKINEVVENYVFTSNIKKGNAISGILEKLLTQEITPQEKRMLTEFQANLSDPIKTRDFFYKTIKGYLDSEYPKPTHDFLDNLFSLLFSYGYYDIIEIFVIQHMHYRSDKEFLLAKAHTLGALDDFESAALCLSNLSDSTTSKNELIDIRTSLVSNLLRRALEVEFSYTSSLNSPHLSHSFDKDIIENKTLKTIFQSALEEYKKIFNNHYYPGINYAYMLSLYYHLFDSTLDQHTKIENIESIYQNSQKSIQENSYDYWSQITNIEFLALLDKYNSQEFEIMLHNTKPTKDNLLRTLRQINFYIDILEHSGKEDKIGDSIKQLREDIGTQIDSI